MNRASAVVAAALFAALAPTSAYASTWTVDDDKADCPNAAFTSIQAAVNQAAPWDTVVICAGTYSEQSVPASGNNSPSQTGSRNGLTITKPLTLKGAGADKVTVRVVADPAAAGNTHEIEVESAAGTASFHLVNAPSPDNPKTSALTALSLVAALRELLDREGHR